MTKRILARRRGYLAGGRGRLWRILYRAEERTMGLIQRIFYFHVSSAWTGFTAFFVCFIGQSSLCLSTRSQK